MKILALNAPSLDLSYFTKRGLSFEVEHKTIIDTFPLKFLYKVKDADGSMVDLYTPDVGEYLQTTYGVSDYDIILVGWKPEQYGDKVKHTGGYTEPIPLSNGCMWATVRQDTIPNNNYALHELHHILCRILYTKQVYPVDFMDTDKNGRPYYLNQFPENPESNYNQTWNQIQKYLSLLVNKKVMPKYKYFSEKEIVGLKPELVAMLDRARGYAGVPFKITSGFRTPEQNKKVGGVQDSSHITGLAVDVLADTSIKKFAILNGAIKVGFNRIGMYNNHIHLDCGKNPAFPENVCWIINKD